MTTPESFVSRWARLKRNSFPRGTEPAETIAQPEIAAADDLAFDPASLPSIEAIDLNTDIRGFLQSRVPAELTRAALRQAWASDPAIRDFIGIAENQWDFNDPEAIPGFGPLPEGYDVSGMLSQALGERDRFAETIPQISTFAERLPSAASDREPADPGLDVPRSTGAELDSLPDDRGGEATEPEHNRVAEANDRSPDQRRHGGALPRQSG